MAAAGFWFAKDLLMVETPPTYGNVLVVLGGGLEDRARYGAQLFCDGLASSVIVTGAGDCIISRDYLTTGGVPPENIRLECDSRSTRENALHTAPILREMGARRVVLVTTWYHGRRAFTTFRDAVPEMELSILCTRPHLVEDRRPTFYSARWVFREYVKLGWYWMRYGISPWGKPTAPASAGPGMPANV